MYEKGFDFENIATEGIIGITIVVAVFLAAVIITAIIVTVRELASIFARRAFQPTTSAKLLWGSLAVLATLWFAAGLLATNDMIGPLVIYAAAWGSLLTVIGWELIDAHEGGRDRAADPEELDSYLDFSTPLPSTNGPVPEAAGRSE